MDMKKILRSKRTLEDWLKAGKFDRAQLEKLVSTETNGRARKNILTLLDKELARAAPEEALPEAVEIPDGYTWSESVDDGDFAAYIKAGWTVDNLISNDYLLPIAPPDTEETAKTEPDAEQPSKAPNGTESTDYAEQPPAEPPESGLITMTLNGRMAQVHPLSVDYFMSCGWVKK